MCRRYPPGGLSIHRWSLLSAGRAAIGRVRDGYAVLGRMLTGRRRNWTLMKQGLPGDETRSFE